MPHSLYHEAQQMPLDPNQEEFKHLVKCCLGFGVYVGVILGSYRVIWGYLGLYRDNGKQNATMGVLLRFGIRT